MILPFVKTFARLAVLLAMFSFIYMESHAQTNIVPDDIELAVLRNIYDSLGGGSWTTKTNWPTAGSWPATATSAAFGTWYGVTVTSGDITRINIPGNNLTGQLPTTIAQLQKLNFLNLQNNAITGRIPSSYGNIPLLTTLFLNRNQLTESIPSTLGNLTQLERLHLHENNLTGPIPSSLGALSQLTQLYLSHNQLTGEVPLSLSNLANLEYLYLRNNQLTGELPASLSTNLQYFNASFNQLSGTIPSAYAGLSELLNFDVSNNELTGAFPDVSGWTKVTQINVGVNLLSGPVPAAIGNCTALTQLRGERNFFTSLPSAALNLPVITTLNFNDNELTSIPDFSTQVNKANLTLQVNKNRLDFGQLEMIVGKGIKSISYNQPKQLNDITYLKVIPGASLVIPGRDPGQNGSMVWERKLDGSTSWVNVDALNLDATQRTFRLDNMSENDGGQYRYRMSNTVVTGFTIESVPIVGRAGFDVVWNGLNGLQDNAGILSKTAATGWGNNRAVSENVLPASQDGWIEFIADQNSTASNYLIGFTAADNDNNRTSIAFGLQVDYQGAQKISAHESSDIGTDLGSWVTGDIFRIARTGNTIKYFKNNVEIRSVAVDPAQEYRLKALINEGKTPLTTASFWIPASRGTVPDAWESAALKALYDSLGGASWTTKANWPTPGNWPTNITSVQMDAWYGITVGSGDITRIDLPVNNLNGVIPSAITKLTKLNVLRIQGNHIQGHIPEFLGKMTSLVTINLANNNLNGGIPSSLGSLTQLNWLGLYNNPLTGTLPTSLFSLPNLEYLYITYTNISGAIPPEVGNLSKILVLHLFENNFTGPIPSTIGNLTKLTSLALSNNETLSGSIPGEIASLTNLVELWLNGNQLSGAIPVSIGNLTKLKTLNLAKNQLEGEIPSSIGNLVNMEWAAFSTNKLSGSIPAGFGNMTKLDSLWLAQNQFTGTLPNALGSVTSLALLSVADNKLEGPLPSWLGDLTLMKTLALGKNNFDGTVPESIANLNRIKHLDLSFTSLEGPVPPSLVNKSTLRTLMVNDSKFTSFPDFSARSDKALLTMSIQNNAIPVQDIERNFSSAGVQPFKVFTYGPQRNMVLVPAIHVPLHARLDIPAPHGGTYGVYLWERLVDNAWVAINSQNQSTEVSRFQINNVGAEWQGTYRYTVTNTWLPDIRFESGPIEVVITDALATTAKAQFNGVISSVRWRTTKAYGMEGEDFTGMYIFDYDDKYQIRDASWASYTSAGYTFSGNKYRVTGMDYDPNGNIKALRRYDKDALRTHNFAYTYEPNKNQLKSVSGYTNAYTYNAIGQMIGEDKVEEGKDQYVEYDVTGKVTKVFSSPAKLAADLKAEYLYDDRGFRLAKVNHRSKRTTWYIRDASGSVISIYEQNGVLSENNHGAFWQDLVNVTDADNVLRVVSGATSGNARSIRQLAAGENGYLEYTITDILQEKNIGVRVPGTFSSYYFNFYSNNNIIAVRRNGMLETSFYYAIGGKVKISREGGQLFFYYNDELKLTQSLSPTNNLEAFSDLLTATATVAGLVWTAEGETDEVPVVLTEIPVYGAGKLGTLYPQQDGSMSYEITDHLGNVRALLRDNIMVYTATMEDNNQTDLSNPRVEEMAYFENLFETEVTDARMNHTAPRPGVENPDKAAYLFWNDTEGTLAEEKAIGPAIALKVNAGDKLDIETWTRFERKTSYAKDFDLIALSSLLGNSFVSAGGFEGYTMGQTASSLQGALTAAAYPNDGSEGTRPFAYLNYIIYNEQMEYQDAGWVRVTDDAGFYPEEIGLPDKKPVRIAFGSAITVQQNGYIYVWVSNQSKETRVWFDDLQVKHTQSLVSQATDYGVWGDVLREQKTDETIYRFGFQGGFSEKDEETGWNHFEAREYDSEIGRWMTADPAKQFHSPYSAFANNPVLLYDPDGRVVPIVAAYLIRRALVYAGKEFVKNFLLDALAQFSANVVKGNDYSAEGIHAALIGVDYGDAALEGAASIFEFKGNNKFQKVMNTAIPILAEILKSTIDFKALAKGGGAEKYRTILEEKGYSAATVDLAAGLASKLAGSLSKALGGGKRMEKFVNEEVGPYMADFVAEWINGVMVDAVENDETNKNDENKEE